MNYNESVYVAMADTFQSICNPYIYPPPLNAKIVISQIKSA